MTAVAPSSVTDAVARAFALPPGRRPVRISDAPGESTIRDALQHAAFYPAGSPPPGRSPLIWAEGGFVAVLRCRPWEGTEWAVRCPLGPTADDAAERYAALASHLKRANGAARYFVSATFLANVLTLDGRDYPLMVLPWVEGVSLSRRMRALAESADRDGLLDLAGRWLTMIVALQDARIAHGDLTPGNTIVTPTGDLVLLDYDNIFVPELAGREAVVNGTPGYAHPIYVTGDQPRPFVARMDTFGALIVLLTLHALAHNPSLLTAFGPEGLLLSSEDLAAPEGSFAFGTLTASEDSTTAFLARKIEEMCRAVSLSDVPLRTVLQMGPPEVSAPVAPPDEPETVRRVVGVGKELSEAVLLPVSLSLSRPAGAEKRKAERKERKSESLRGRFAGLFERRNQHPEETAQPVETGFLAPTALRSRLWRTAGIAILAAGVIVATVAAFLPRPLPPKVNQPDTSRVRRTPPRGAQARASRGVTPPRNSSVAPRRANPVP
jgi:serine/threonine protein kinase